MDRVNIQLPFHDNFSSGYRAILTANLHAQTPGQESTFCELLTTHSVAVSGEESFVIAKFPPNVGW